MDKKIVSSESFVLQFFGTLCVVGGIFGVLYALNMDVSVESGSTTSSLLGDSMRRVSN